MRCFPELLIDVKMNGATANREGALIDWWSTYNIADEFVLPYHLLNIFIILSISIVVYREVRTMTGICKQMVYTWRSVQIVSLRQNLILRVSLHVYFKQFTWFIWARKLGCIDAYWMPMDAYIRTFVRRSSRTNKNMGQNNQTEVHEV